MLEVLEVLEVGFQVDSQVQGLIFMMFLYLLVLTFYLPFDKLQSLFENVS